MNGSFHVRGETIGNSEIEQELTFRIGYSEVAYSCTLGIQGTCLKKIHQQA